MTTTAERSVLHVLPHPGGGGETYVDLLADMLAYRFTKVYLAKDPRPTPLELAQGVFHALRCGRRHDLVHAHGEPAAGLCMALLALRPSVITTHGLSLSRRLNGFAYRAAALNLRAVVRVADRTVCACRAERATLERIAGAAAASSAVVVNNGIRIPPARIETERRAARQELGLDDEAPVGIWVGTLDENKDPLVAIHAAQAASVPLLVVGDGPLRAQVEREAAETTQVLGQRGDVPRLLDAADFFVFTSHREGLSFSLLEAMGHRLPTVVTSLPENLEAIGDAGIAVRADVDSIAAALRALARDPAERARLGQRASHRIETHFSAAEMERRTRALYDDVLAGRPHVS
jgi:glycosyltransferase involved in cell wall biosynthesis